MYKINRLLQSNLWHLECSISILNHSSVVSNDPLREVKIMDTDENIKNASNGPKNIAQIWCFWVFLKTRKTGDFFVNISPWEENLRKRRKVVRQSRQKDYKTSISRLFMLFFQFLGPMSSSRSYEVTLSVHPKQWIFFKPKGF